MGILDTFRRWYKGYKLRRLKEKEKERIEKEKRELEEKKRELEKALEEQKDILERDVNVRGKFEEMTKEIVDKLDLDWYSAIEYVRDLLETPPEELENWEMDFLADFDTP